MKRLLGVIAAIVFCGGCAHSHATTPSRTIFGMPVKTLSTSDISQSNSLYAYMKGDILALEGQPQKAIPELTAAIQHNPDSAYLYYDRAMSYAAAQQLQLAEDDCKKALELAPKLTEAKLLLARLLSVQSKFAQMVPLLEDVIRTTPDDREAYSLLGLAYMNTGKASRSIPLMKKLLDIDPDAMVAYYYMGAAYGGPLNRPQLAIQMYRKILEQDPRNVSVYTSMAQLYVDHNQIRQAIEILNEASTNGVDDITMQLRLSALYYQEKQYSKAAEILEAVLQRTPNSSKVHYYLGVIYEENGEFDKADAQFQKITPDSNYYKDAVLRRALHFYRQSQLNAAIAVLQSGILHAPKVDEFYPLLAIIYEEVDNLPAARSTLQKGVKALPDNASILYTLAVLTDRMKDTSKAVKLMQKVLILEPNNVSAMNYIGYIWTEEGKHLDEAEVLLLHAAELQPGDGFILDSLGWLYFKKNEYGKAQTLLEQAVRRIPNEAVVHRHLAMLYVAMERNQEAIEQYRQAILLAQGKPSDDANVNAMVEALDALEKK
ncbi:MAG: hypothetical protein COV45_03555 [Deltaproteobacteria bacterium CG11_big_fil_rev_8_21_14_0_20_47_16]|nr:MAG: hypothetical protein COV45_03555 [Deltaproteobacteria bacterium CG11_big_fil_rev_8_21_14_0_20_47_16]